MNEYDVLIVEDNPADLEILRRFLKAIDSKIFQVRHKETLPQVIETVENSPPDLMILDHVLSRRTGIEILSAFQNRDHYLPVIMVTGEGNETLLSHSLRQGADDYISKSDLTPGLLEHSIDYVLEKAAERFRRDLKILELEMAGETDIDLLTGLPNRDALIDRLETELGRHAGDGERYLYLIFLDLDDFQRVNDRKGFLAGDELLKLVGSTMTSEIQEEDFVARFGSDEFCVITSTCRPVQEKQMSKTITENIEERLNQWLDEQNLKFFMTISLGVVKCDPQLKSPKIHLQKARQKMLKSKKKQISFGSDADKAVSS